MSLSGAAVSFSPTVVAPDGRRIEVESFRLGMTSMPALRADSHCRITASTWARSGVDVRNEGHGTARAWGTGGDAQPTLSLLPWYFRDSHGEMTPCEMRVSSPTVI